MGWVRPCSGFSCVIPCTGLSCSLEFPSMPSLYPLEGTSSSLFSTPWNCYITSPKPFPWWKLPACGACSLCGEAVGHGAVSLAILDRSSWGPASQEATTPLWLWRCAEHACCKAPRVSVSATAGSALIAQCEVTHPESNLRLILFPSFSSLLWFLQLPVATQWCCTVTFTYNTLFSFCLSFSPRFQLPQAQKVISFLSHRVIPTTRRRACPWCYAFDSVHGQWKGPLLWLHQSQLGRIRVPQPVFIPHPQPISPAEEPSHGQGLKRESICKNFL